MGLKEGFCWIERFKERQAQESIHFRKRSLKRMGNSKKKGSVFRWKMLRQIFSGYDCPTLIVVNKFTHTHQIEKQRGDEGEGGEIGTNHNLYNTCEHKMM